MSEIYYSARSLAIANLFNSIPTDVKKALVEDVDWGVEKDFNAHLWPKDFDFKVSERCVPYLVGLRPGFKLDRRYFGGETPINLITVQGEQEIWYMPDGKKPVLITLGDTFLADEGYRQPTSKSITQLIDEIVFGNHSGETETNLQGRLFAIPGVALQNSAWQRTVYELIHAYKRTLDGRVEASSERVLTKVPEGTKLDIEEIREGFFEHYIKEGIDAFLEWGRRNGLDPELLKQEFMDLPYTAEQELWDNFTVNHFLTNLRLRKLAFE